MRRTIYQKEFNELPRDKNETIVAPANTDYHLVFIVGNVVFGNNIKLKGNNRLTFRGKATFGSNTTFEQSVTFEKSATVGASCNFLSTSIFNDTAVIGDKCVFADVARFTKSVDVGHGIVFASGVSSNGSFAISKSNITVNNKQNIEGHDNICFQGSETSKVIFRKNCVEGNITCAGDLIVGDR